MLLNYKNYYDTISCIKSILKLTYKDFSIVVVDNDSQNDSVTKIKEYLFTLNNFDRSKCVLVENTVNSGYAGGMNFGQKYGKKNSIIHFYPFKR